MDKTNTTYEYYKRHLNNVRFQRVIASKYNYSYMPIRFENIEKRDEIYTRLIKNNIKPRKYFYPLTTSFDYFRKDNVNLVEKYGLKNASDIANGILCLPIYPDLSFQDVNKIINIINNGKNCHLLERDI